jgi:DNA-binding response OmpR family regulator
MRVLIVEDDPAVRPFLDAFLTAKGFVTLTAPHAAAADALLLDFPADPDIAILDLLLPGRNGLAYGDELRSRYPAIHLVFITGWQEGVDFDAAARRGRLLIKPFFPNDLLEMIRHPHGDE